MKFTAPKWRKWTLLLWVGLWVASLLTPFYGPTYASVPKLDQIRIALFINTPQYSTTQPTVTLTSDHGFDIGVRTSTGVKTWVSHSDTSTIRTSLDQFSIQVLETTDFVQAKAAYDKMSTYRDKSYLFSKKKQGKTVFQLWVGSFSTKAEAISAIDSLNKDAAAGPLVKLSTPVVTGPNHWSAGTYSTEAEAQQQAQVISQVGVTVDIAIQENSSGDTIYSVWIGNEIDLDQLNSLKQLTSALLPNLVLQPIPAGTYLLRRNDVSLSSTGIDGIPHYVFNAEGQKTWIHPIQAGTKVRERFDRSYRGNIELSRFNGNLAVINELPFEEYLYSVVSSELDKSWPLEALKAQAVAARTFAIKQGVKYQIAQVTDTTMDQAYKGTSFEFDTAVQAVDATRGEVLIDGNGLITPFYSANAGGLTAAPSEVWGSSISYLKSVPSPDEAAASGKAIWFQVLLASGQVGYVHSSYMKKTEQMNTAGLVYYEATAAGVNVRPAPGTDNDSNPSFAKLSMGDKALVLGRAAESNSFSWTRGPFDAETLQNKLAGSGTSIAGSLQSLEVSQRGPSGRVTEVKVNGQPIKLSSPNALRTALGGLPSTRFEIEETGRYTIGGAGGIVRRDVDHSSPLYVVSGGKPLSTVVKEPQFFIMGGNQQIHRITKENKFVFKGQGFGHGLGMSQWGAKGYADLGYDYKKILQAYYNGVSITKE